MTDSCEFLACNGKSCFIFKLACLAVASHLRSINERGFGRFIVVQALSV